MASPLGAGLYYIYYLEYISRARMRTKDARLSLKSLPSLAVPCFRILEGF